MKRNSLLIYTIALSAVPALGSAQTFLAGNPTASTFYGGSLFAVRNDSAAPIQLTGLFDLKVSGTGATNRSYQVYAKPGPVTFATTGPGGKLTPETVSGWSLFGGANGVTTNAQASYTTINANNTLVLAPGSSVGLAIFFTTPGLETDMNASGYIGYGGGSATYSDANVSILPGGAVAYRGFQTQAELFDQMAFTPRTFAGRVQYATVPEPFTIAALGLGIAGFAVRRRRSR